MIQKQNITNTNKRKVNLSLMALAAVLTVGVLAAVSVNFKKTGASPKISNKVTITKSIFVFDGTKAPGWRQGPTNGTSMALFSDDRNCFVSIQQKDGALDEIKELKSTQESLGSGGYQVSNLGGVAVSLSSSSKNINYQLHQYEVTGSGSAGQLYRGQEIGYIALGENYLRVEGYCNLASQLPATMPAIHAINYTAVE